MKKILVLLIFILPLSGCNKCDDSRTNYVKNCGGCPEGMIEFSNTQQCLRYRKGERFYFGEVSFNCLEGPFGISIISSNNSGSFIYYPYDNVGNSPTSVIISDFSRYKNRAYSVQECRDLSNIFAILKNDITELPSKVEVNLVHKFSADFDSRTLDSTIVTLSLQDK